MNKISKIIAASASAIILQLVPIYPLIGRPDYGYFTSFWPLFILCLFINIASIIKISGFKNLKSNWDYFIMPSFLIAGAFFLIPSFPNTFIQFIISLLFGFSLYFLYNALLACQEKKITLPVSYRNLLTILSLIIVLLMSGLIFNFYVYWELSVYHLIIPHFLMIYGINHFLTKQMLIAPIKYSHLYSLIISFVIAQIAWVLSFWIVYYPSLTVKQSFSYLGMPVASIIILICYYCIWGIVYYLIEGRLTHKVVNEYLSIGLITLILILLTTKWLPIV